MHHKDSRSIADIVMKNIVEKNVIRQIIADREASRSPLLFATSLEVSHRAGLSVDQVEKAAHDIPGIKIGKTLNHEYYKFST